MENIRRIEAGFLKRKLPEFGSGDTVRVHVQVEEGEKVRTQIFQGVVISRRGAGTGETFIVRKISDGIGVERIFPLHSPNLAKLEVVRRGRVRRGKLYYLRKMKGKDARIKPLRTDKR